MVVVLNAGAYHPDGTSSSYSTYLKKFAAFVDCEPYVIGDMCDNYSY